MKVAILGYGAQGRAAYEYWAGGHEITICDREQSLDVPEGARSQLGEDYLHGLDRFDLIIRSPGIHPRDIVTANEPHILDKVTTVTNEFFQVCPTRNIIGVTGTKGKGTTSTLIAQMLEAAGQRVHLGGNIGTPPLELLHKDIKKDDWVVLELANFQLIDLRHSPHIALCLMVVPEHLDWHGQMEEYIEAKSQLFSHQSQDDIAIYYAGNATSQQVAAASPGHQIPYYTPPGAAVEGDAITIGGQAICKTDELKLLGKHNWQNVCAAVTAVWQITQDTGAMHSILTNFSGLEHRLEFVREFKGISYYNDSFGTTPETAIAAIEAFDQPQVVILGGRGKGVGFGELAKTLKTNGNVARVLVIGEAGQQIAAALDAADYRDYVISDVQTMPEIVQESTRLAEALAASAGENIVVLLSTACTSFDMFDNYKQRGEAFRQAVQSLA